KHIAIARPTDCRYVKLEVRRGTRPDGTADNAVRLYGVDIYGAFTRSVSRGNNVSVGKTILKYAGAANEREQAPHLLVGAKDGNRKWCFYAADPAADPYRFAVVDLEAEYDISSIQLIDSRSIETGSDNKNLDTYQVYAATERPDLTAITTQGDTNTCWTLIHDGHDEGSVSDKRMVFTPAVRARYLKLWIPRTTAEMNDMKAAKLFGLNVYGTAATALATPQAETTADTSCYDLSGIRRPSPTRGVMIMDGRKVLCPDEGAE
ncbi:MAG: hypothetical protein HUK03_06015, partial [Bacteroidaceae bacterium]|nr:hypothetical protein [Bacteroidaceae bacterium]